ncbi:MAG TPA: saccharopine dehydrogenase NADP-binding domain-containing protein [Dermatophilaceae bacterium]|nr:saccharopine dehydrogenase NADP-binding domain-containing protein [Dermatophilaceae bacterium]
MSDTTPRDLDIVIFGATGFVGRLTAAYLAERAPAGVRIALAGRNHERLEEVRAGLPDAAAGWEIIVADASEPVTLAALAARTRVVATTVGPYVRLGMPLVEACAIAGTHYCDLTGEVLFVRQSADTWHETARETGARIVHSCGFDSIPSDLGVLVTADTVAADGAGELTETVLSVVSMRGGVSGGTIDSMRQQAILMRADAAVRAIVADPYGLSPDRPAEPRSRGAEAGAEADAGADAGAGAGALAKTVWTSAVRLVRRSPIRRDPVTGHWTGPFVMAGFNTRIVRRSNALLGWRYGRAFRYREVVDFGNSAKAPVLATGMSAGLLGLAGAMAFEPTRAVVDRFLPKPGEGPSEENQANGRFRMVIRTTTTTGAAYRTKVGADRDPGYSGTAVMLGESALALALDGDLLPGGGGVLTPATGLGSVLVDRLVAQGFTFDCERVDS